jgi:hypothetical protein
LRQLFLSIIVLAFMLSVMSAQAIGFRATVVDVLDAVTLDVRIGDEIVRVRLANLSPQDITTDEGLGARNFASATLLNRSIWIDLRENSSMEDGIVRAVVYLVGPDAQPVVPSYNEIFGNSGYIADENSSGYEPYPLNQFVRDVWIPESLKVSDEMLDTEHPSIEYSESNPTEWYQDPIVKECPPGSICIQ